jgi:putative ABC transport system substrate-binding protein
VRCRFEIIPAARTSVGVRFTQGDPSLLAGAARDLVRDGASILFTNSDAAAVAAKSVTSTVPIIFAGADAGADPIELGLVRSIAHPGGNVTGVTELGNELAAKRLQVFRELVPGLRRALVIHAGGRLPAAEIERYRHAAGVLGITLVEKPVRSRAEAEAAFEEVRPTVVQGILVTHAVTWNIPGLALAAGARLRLATIFPSSFWVERGGLASYGPDYYATGRQAARLVDKIVKGTKPANIPVESNPKIQFAINATTAKILGLSISPEMMIRADRVIH